MGGVVCLMGRDVLQLGRRRLPRLFEVADSIFCVPSLGEQMSLGGVNIRPSLGSRSVSALFYTCLQDAKRSTVLETETETETEASSGMLFSSTNLKLELRTENSCLVVASETRL